jgi:aryl-alcohol dehydrogenase-like predicted oxidoreductase
MRKRASSSTVLPTSLDASRPAALRASEAATAKFAEDFAPRFGEGFYRPGPAGLTLSSIGIGTYLGECDDAEDECYADTVAGALASGVNVLDTAINYRCQRSERAVGSGIERALAAGTVTRDQMVVCTKGGYVPLDDAPPPSREHYRDYLKREFFDTGVLTPDDIVAGGHSMSPNFLRYTIARSRRNLGLRTLDVFLLHNPEQQASVLPPKALRERLRAAFMVLEDAAARGEIGVYGCATWSAFRVPPDTKGHLSMRGLVELAREIAGDNHRFRVVQLPVNLAMTEAMRTPTQPGASGGGDALLPALNAAAELELSVMASASLMQAQLTRGLPDTVRELYPSLETDAQRALAFVRSLPAVTTALVGMRSRAHLEENLGSGRI